MNVCSVAYVRASTCYTDVKNEPQQRTVVILLLVAMLLQMLVVDTTGTQDSTLGARRQCISNVSVHKIISGASRGATALKSQ